VRGYMHGNANEPGHHPVRRQFMNSLADSSLEECKRAIEDEPFLAAYYEIGDNYIKSKDGRIQFAFAGLDRNIASVKSKGRILLCWVDEAEPVTDERLDNADSHAARRGRGLERRAVGDVEPKRKTAAVETRFRKSTDPLIKRR
jgi:phage terminase large subunit